MIGLSRRRLLGGAAAAAGSAGRHAALAAARPAQRGPRSSATRASTRWSRRAPQAQAFAVRDGRIIAVGSNEAISCARRRAEARCFDATRT